MPKINNKTRRPITVPLPDGKKLRLGPLKTGQVQPKALEHPPLLKLVESGDIEIDQQDQRGTSGSSQDKSQKTSGRDRSGGIQHTGDR